jgi:hypothetical protein
MATKKDPDILYVRKGATLREIYAAARAAFTAEDLEEEYRKATTGPQVPVAQLLRELDQINAKEKANFEKRKKPRDQSASNSKKKK